MALIKFNTAGRMADNGKAGDQFDHAIDQTLDVSPECAQAAVGYGIADHVTRKSEGSPAENDKRNADKTDEKSRIKNLKSELKELGGTSYSKFSEAELIDAIADINSSD